MDPNTLLVSVLSARGLYLKGHNKMDALVTVTMHGKGTSARSRAVTEVVHTEGEVTWDEHMEFKVSDLSMVLTVCAQHKSRIGRNDVIGRVELPLDEARRIHSDHWFPLRKKSGEDKYRGELQLRFHFRYEKPSLSISNQSLNTIGHKDSMMDKLKGKIKLGKLRNKGDPDSMSIASGISTVSGVSAFSKISKSGTLSRLGFGKKKHKDVDQLSNTLDASNRLSVGSSVMSASMHELNGSLSSPALPPLGQSNPPAVFQRSGSRRWNASPLAHSNSSMQNGNGNGGSLGRNSSAASLGNSAPHFNGNNNKTSVINSNINSNPFADRLSDDMMTVPQQAPVSPSVSASAMSTAESFNRPPSVASSGFGSNHRNQGDSQNMDDLLSKIDKLEMELRVKDSRMRDMEEYLDHLLSRVMEKCPDVLATPGGHPLKNSSRRFFSTMGF